ncbi:MAG: hypothetical protein ABIA75_12475 [Candidatus Neomarinimicrobiota bacterium]
MGRTKITTVVLVLVLLLGACASRPLATDEIIITGKIYLTGNEPFTRLAVSDERGVHYLLTGADSILSELYQLQGSTVKLYCSKIVHSKTRNVATIVNIEKLH